MLSSEPLEHQPMQNKISSMKHDKLEQLTAEDDMDASTKVSNAELESELILEQENEEEELISAPSVKMIKTNHLVKEFTRILESTPDKIGETALKTW
jgi:hypothetical protein